MPHTPVRSSRLRSVLTGGAVPLLLLTGLPAQAHAQEAAVHTVRPGDSLTRISAARGVSVADLARIVPIINYTTPQVGSFPSSTASVFLKDGAILGLCQAGYASFTFIVPNLP